MKRATDQSHAEEDKTFNMLVSRVACIAKLQHKPIGYSGPLSRQLLCYRSLICEVRTALRNLIESVLASLLLSGDADRDRKDWVQLGIKYACPSTAPGDAPRGDVLTLTIGFRLLTTTTVVSVSLCEPTWTTCRCKPTPHHRRLVRRSSPRARNGSSTVRASPAI